jgi:tetratricopeptide (TPR) repeat protein
LDRKTGNIFHLYASTNALGFAYQILGEMDKSAQCFNEALSISRQLDDFQAISGGYDYLGLSAFDKGDYVKAKEFFEKLNLTLETAGDKSSQANASQYLIWTYIELGETEKAKNLIENMSEFALQAKNNDLIASLDALKAMLLRDEKKWEESINYFEKSLQKFETLKARQWSPYFFARMVLLEYAGVYLQRDQLGDREKADKLVNQALDLFQKTGAKKDVEKTLKLMEVLHPPKVQIGEKTVSSVTCVCDEVQSNIVATPTELKIGESLELEMEVTNTHKERTVLLSKIVEVIPVGFAVAKKPESYRVEGKNLNLKKKLVEPSKTEEVKLVLTPKIQGKFYIKPRILYLDENGNEKTCEPKPISITVKELGIKGWIKGER